MIDETDIGGYQYVPAFVTKPFLKKTQAIGCCKFMVYLTILIGLMTYLCIEGFPGLITLLGPHLE